MSKYNAIQAYEEAIQLLQNEIKLIRSAPEKQGSVKPGDIIVCTSSVDWAYNKGERMIVDSVYPNHILIRSLNPRYRDSYVFHCPNNDWEKD